ncbi:LysE family transporter [Spirosoma sp. SC4-14]|uniref:LysE family translocator n=1 Tax=Spirosoma sp. SC4-14 TaxID=3128900 RepID=UPI0030CD01EA
MITLFLLVSLISFIGSLHPGAVNIAVMQATIGQSRRAGFWLALGGSLPEIAYSTIAIRSLALVNPNTVWFSLLKILPIPVLLIAGLIAFRQKKRAVPIAQQPSAFPFWKGIVLSSANPQLLPFWSAVWLYLHGTLLFTPIGPLSQWVFSFGTATGAFVLLSGIVWLADRYRTGLLHYLNHSRLNRLTGAAFIGMALWQISQFL